jgi:hypothetical protein
VPRLSAVLVCSATPRRHVWLGQLVPVDPNSSGGIFMNRVAGKADQTLYECPRSSTVARAGSRWCMEDNDLTPFGSRESVADLARDHSVRKPALASKRWSCAVEGRLHRRGWDAERLCDLSLECEHTTDCNGDRDHPIDHRTPGPREAARCAIQHPHQINEVIETP